MRFRGSNIKGVCDNYLCKKMIILTLFYRKDDDEVFCCRACLEQHYISNIDVRTE